MITLRQYLEETNRVIKEHPEYLDLPLIYSSDDEGNEFKYSISLSISPCYSENINSRLIESDDIEFDTDNPNLICIN